MLDKNTIDKLLEPVVSGLGFEYICSEISNTGNEQKKGISILRVFIDRLDSSNHSGISLDDCTKVSRHIARVLDVEQGIATTKYNLEISSPGLDRPLVKIEHFKKFLGKKVKVKLNLPIEHVSSGIAQRNIIGHLVDVKPDNKILISDLDFKDVMYTVDFNNISKANLVPEWA